MQLDDIKRAKEYNEKAGNIKLKDETYLKNKTYFDKKLCKVLQKDNLTGIIIISGIICQNGYIRKG